MFRTFKIAVLLFLCLFQAGVIYGVWHFPLSSSALFEWKVLRKKPKSVKATLQNRHNVIKEIWIQNGDERLQYHIEAPSAALMLTKSKKSIEVEESLSHVRMWMQEHLFKTTQAIRYLKANEACYNYTSLHFDADDAFIATYQTSGTSLLPISLPTNSLMKGSAKHVSLFFENNYPMFEAEEFSAYIHSQDLSGHNTKEAL